LPAVHLIVPVADRERMLWLAEKCTELGATSWHPVLWQRSRSVFPRGEGATFRAKIAARMASALEQSGRAWLPDLHSETSVAETAAASRDGIRLLLDPDGEPIATSTLSAPVTIATGPEGGVEADERDALVAAGFRLVTLGDAILRFETAAIAALAIVRARLVGGRT
jgi:16S rRNA (uracil1498-N3)-methyltransferase